MHLDYPQKTNGLYLLNRQNIEEIETGILEEHMPAVLNSPCAVNIKWLAEEEYGLDIQHYFLTYDSSILGLIAFAHENITVMDNTFNKIITEIDEGTVIIERTLMGRSNFCRYRFTLAHEVSHWLIHRPFHSPTNKQYEFRTAIQSYIACRSADIENKKHINRDDTDWQEWQADSLAAALLMPRNTFTDACMKISSELGIRFSQLQSAKIEKCVAYTFVKKLAELFQVSATAVSIRLKNLGICPQIFG